MSTGAKLTVGRRANSLVAQMVKHLPTMRETRVRSLGWEVPLEKDFERSWSFPKVISGWHNRDSGPRLGDPTTLTANLSAPSGALIYLHLSFFH